MRRHWENTNHTISTTMCQISAKYWATTKIKLGFTAYGFRNKTWCIPLFKGPRLVRVACSSVDFLLPSTLLPAKVRLAAGANGCSVLKIHHQNPKHLNTSEETRECIKMLHWHVQTHLPSRDRGVPTWIKDTLLLEEKHVEGPSPFHGDVMNCWPLVRSCGIERDQN